MLGGPDRIEAKVLGFIHQLHLFLDDLVFGLADGVFEQVEHAQLHGSFP